MFRSLRVKTRPEKFAPDPLQTSIDEIISDPSIPVSIHSLNVLPQHAKQRLYRALLPVSLLTTFGIDQRNWKGRDGEPKVRLVAEPGTGFVNLSAWTNGGPDDPFYFIELLDNSLNGIDLRLLVINDPNSARYSTDRDPDGRPTEFGTVRRNVAAEQQAKGAGLAPGQVRRGLRASTEIFSHLESFLTLLAHHAYFLEPLTYASAWVFERRGFAYVRGHKLMEDIHREFTPGGRLHRALDGSTAFRAPDQWNTVRGRSWAIHDGALEALGEKWDHLRMIKQIGRHAGVDTFPGALY